MEYLGLSNLASSNRSLRASTSWSEKHGFVEVGSGFRAEFSGAETAESWKAFSGRRLLIVHYGNRSIALRQNSALPNVNGWSWCHDCSYLKG